MSWWKIRKDQLLDMCTQVLMVFVLLYLHLLESSQSSSMFNAALDEDLSETPITCLPLYWLPCSWICIYMYFFANRLRLLWIFSCHKTLCKTIDKYYTFEEGTFISTFDHLPVVMSCVWDVKNYVPCEPQTSLSAWHKLNEYETYTNDVFTLSDLTERKLYLFKI